jgi:hypothetical protein
VDIADRFIVPVSYISLPALQYAFAQGIVEARWRPSSTAWRNDFPSGAKARTLFASLRHD